MVLGLQNNGDDEHNYIVDEVPTTLIFGLEGYKGNSVSMFLLISGTEANQKSK